MNERNGRSGGMIRAALFGAGKMAMQHARAIQLQGNARVVAAADPVRPKEEILKAMGEGVEFYSDAEDLLRNVKPDVVHICTPPATHVPLAALALQHGSHIYVEKPFTLTARDAAGILSLAEGKGLRVCAGHQLLYESPSLRADEVLPKLGRIVHIESYFSFRPVRRSRDGRSPISSIDQLVDIMPHPTYLLLHFLKKNLPEEEMPVRILSMEVKTTGSVHGIVRCGDVTGCLIVTLEGRPVESYVKVVGSNGCLYADFIRGAMIPLPGPGVTAISKIIGPYRHSRLMFSETTRALLRRVFKKQKSYPGLFEMIEAYYGSIRSGSPSPVRYSSIVETVSLCEEAGKRLAIQDAEEQSIAGREHARLESALPPPDRSRGGVLVTGGTGMLGRAAASELRRRNWPVRIVARKIPAWASRIPGVEYVEGDLASEITTDVLNDISIVVHCAAETAGGKEDHERNSIGATRNVIQAMGKAGVTRLIHISSVAVLKTSREFGGPVAESTPLALGDLERGPYVWGKAESERLVGDLSKSLGIQARIVRPGPLVSFQDFDPPGRLGREVGPVFVMVGGPKDKLSLCTVEMAAEVIREYAEKFDSMPPVLNLIESDSPTRSELVSILMHARPDLKSFRVPSGLLWVLSPFLKALQRIVRPGKTPLDLYSAFASEKYDSRLADEVIRNIRESASRGSSGETAASTFPASIS